MCKDIGHSMTWIYFALVDHSEFKIGYADNLSRRMQEHRRTPVGEHDVELKAAVTGSVANEGFVHRYFSEERRGTLEMFKASERLTNYVRWLRNQWFTVINDDSDSPGSVAYGFWEPRAERQTPPPRDPLFPPDFMEFPGRIITPDDYYTNEKVLSRVRQVFGGIDLDPASCPDANRYVKAETFYSIEDSGLDHRWKGRVWLNPPFSQWQKWVPKIIAEWEAGGITSMCVLSAMRTVTAKYFRPLLDACSLCCVITGRLPFAGRGTESPDDGHCVLYFGTDHARFTKIFGDIGSVWSTATH